MHATSAAQKRPSPANLTIPVGSDRDLLMELAKLRKAPLGKRVVHIMTSALSKKASFEQSLMVTNEASQSLLMTGAHGRLFNISNGDVVFIYSQIPTPAVVTLCANLEAQLFDGLEPARNVYGEYPRYKMFDAAHGVERVIEGVRKSLAQEVKVKPRKPAIDTENLFAVIQKIRNANIRSIVFNQPIYNMAHLKTSIEFLEFYTSIEKLEQVFCPDFSLASDPWHFNLVKRELDLALMRAIVNEIPHYRHKAFSINLLVHSFMSQAFEDFSRALPAKLSGKVYVELDKTDIIEHSRLLGEIFERGRQMGVPVCIDGLSHHDLKLMRLNDMTADYVKVKWDNDITKLAQADVASLVRTIRSSPSQVILTRCDNPKSLAFAKTMGINFVQGHLADEFFRMGSKME